MSAITDPNNLVAPLSQRYLDILDYLDYLGVLENSEYSWGNYELFEDDNSVVVVNPVFSEMPKHFLYDENFTIEDWIKEGRPVSSYIWERREGDNHFFDICEEVARILEIESETIFNIKLSALGCEDEPFTSISVWVKDIEDKDTDRVSISIDCHEFFNTNKSLNEAFGGSETAQQDSEMFDKLFSVLMPSMMEIINERDKMRESILRGDYSWYS